MKRALACLCAVSACSLAAASSVESAQSRLPRFLVSISGSQHFEWTLQETTPGACSFEGHGEQSESFGTARPVKVIAPPNTRAARFKEFQAFNGRGWGRTVPLTGRETRSYRVMRPATPSCTVAPEFRRDCSGTNPLLPRAGVAIIRAGRNVALNVPVDTPWINRRPVACDIRLFDIRNFYEVPVFGVREYNTVRGGTFENRRAKTLRWTINVRYCAAGFDFELRFRPCSQPAPRGSALTGEITASWLVTFRRTR